jgi:NADH:ubiquinone oxidoreductase subunit B-like Fe-S oxidoreductase
MLILAGVFNKKSLIRAKRVYEQAPKPIIVVAFGGCACTGSMFTNSYNVDPPVGKHIPVDAYLAGCPPKPEALISAVVKLIAKLKGK